jgi:glucosamine-6-phosphate deaminase
MIDLNNLYEWCSIPANTLPEHPKRRMDLQVVQDATALGYVMARDLADEIKAANREQRVFRLIVPCGPMEWYAPFARIINAEYISLKNVICFHMDENLDWEAKLLPEQDPGNFRTFMHRYFYNAVDVKLCVEEKNRHYLTPDNISELSEMILSSEIDYTLGGWGQDGHVAFNQARRSPYSSITLDDLRNSTARVQENNYDTILALSQRNMGGAWQFMPPMSVTLGVRECFHAKKVRVYSATGAWKQTALRVALFSEPTVEYPMTLLQEHPDSLITATYETTRHPISEHPEWELRGVSRRIQD